jgi:hypothetical protein
MAMIFFGMELPAHLFSRLFFKGGWSSWSLHWVNCGFNEIHFRCSLRSYADLPTTVTIYGLTVSSTANNLLLDATVPGSEAGSQEDAGSR